MRQNAMRLSRIWRDRPMSPLDTGVYWVERTARLGHALNMDTPAKNLPAYQIALLDVLAAMVVSITLLVIFVILALKTILNTLSALAKVFTNKGRKEKLQ